MTIYTVVSDKTLFSYDGSAKPKTDIGEILINKDTKWNIKPISASIYWQAPNEEEVKSAVESQTYMLEKDDIVITQYPLYVNYGYDKKYIDKVHSHGGKVIGIIHDIDILRGLSDTFDMETLNAFDVIIINSQEFIQRLIKEGLKTKYVVKEFWDFLNDHYTYQDKPFSKDLIYAGSLDSNKAKFLDTFPNNLDLTLWGTNKENRKFKENVHYQGEEISENLLFKIKRGIGLIYDGEPKDNKYNEYNKYNTSYKSGLYAASGIPWLVREDTHLGSVVKRYYIGATFKEFTYEELSKGITYIDKNFGEIQRNLNKMGNQTLKGEFLLLAIDKALAII